MNPELLERVDAATPNLNDKICQGLATDQMRGAELYIDRILQEAGKDFPEGLEYMGYRRATPKEEFEIVTRERDGKPTYELARSDFYLAAYNFEYNGEKLYTRYMYLPFVDVGGIIHVRGNKFTINPVLADPAFSVGGSNMFIQLTRAKLTFERTIHHYMTNQAKSRETTYVAWSWVHMQARKRLSRKTPGRVTYSTLAHYLFAKYGVTKTFSEFTGADVVVGDETTITPETHPSDKWVVCSSTGIKPRAITSNFYKSSRIRMAIPKKQYTPSVQSLVGGFFYLADHFPQRITHDVVDDTWPWRVTLGLIIDGPGVSDGLMVNEVNEHLISLGEFIDKIVWEELKREGIECKTIYELFMYVIDTLSQKTGTSDVEISSMYNKRLMTLRFVLNELVIQINTLMYKLRATKKKRNALTIDEINNLMNQFLKINKITGISNHSNHAEVNSVNTSSDNLYFSITSNIITQESASGGGKKAKVNLKDPAKHLHVSIAEVASYCAMSKSDPTGRNRINPFVQLGEHAAIARHKDLEDVLDYTQERLTR